MKLNRRLRDGVVILEPQGRITIGEGDVMLRQAVEEALAAGTRNVLIDFKNTKAIDSSGIAELVAAHSGAKSRGGELKLANLTPKVQDVLGVTQLVTVFDIFHSEDEAIRSYQPVMELVPA